MICIHIVLLICYVPLFKIGLDLTQFSRLVLCTTFQNCCLLWIDNYNTKLSDFEIPTSIWNGFNKIMRRKYDVDLTRRVDTQNELGNIWGRISTFNPFPISFSFHICQVEF